MAYVLTALEDVYGKTGNYSQVYSLNDMQTAYWLSLGQNPGGKGTPEGRTLHEYAEDYAEFVEETSEKYNASIDSSKAQVIADRTNQQYIVGPFSVNYPEYVEQDISYVKSLSINNGSLIYDENHGDFELILEKGGTTIPGANGMSEGMPEESQRHFPTDGENFFIKFPASSIGYATSINLGVQFEYISGTTIGYDTLDTYADIYKYYGYSEIGGDYAMAEGSATIKVTYSFKKEPYEEVYDYYWETVEDKDEEGNVIGSHQEKRELKRWVYENDPQEKTYSFRVLQPYIKMGDEPEQDDLSAQTLTIAKDGQRTYKIETRDVNIDLSMELGGYVWEDAAAGKESVQDGKFSGESPIPNVTVTLYKKDGTNETKIDETKTDDAGKYTFSGLNAMYQYYVKFTYNGQYYQPTTYVSGNDEKNGWGKGTWEVNSNATDKVGEREQLNVRFEKIGSTPENYEGLEGINKTYTKQELLDAGIIDKFGNLVGDSNASMVKYVKDCMMDAYTGENTGTKDLYPVPAKFLIDSSFKFDYKKLLSNKISGVSILYPSAYYINLGLNPREESDLAINKDVEKVTLEINGQKHVYNYDNLDKYKCKTCGHEGMNEELINVNGTLICPNCQFKCGDCKHEGKNYEIVIAKNEYGRDVQKCPKCEKTNITQAGYDIIQAWDIDLRLSEVVEKDANGDPLYYYDKSYSREIYPADYLYKASMYGDPDANEDGISDIFGKKKEDELEVYITYKIMIRNQAMSIQAKVDEIVDYFDKDLSYVDERSYIQIKRGENEGIYEVKASENSRYSAKTKTTIDGYKNLYITGLDDKYLTAGQTAYVYLTFKVNKEIDDAGEAWVILDEYLESGDPIIENKEQVDAGKEEPIYSVGKENIVEINGYSTRYAPGTQVPNVGNVGLTPAGIVDRDSNPGNLDKKDVPKDGKINYENFEDDTDKAPNIRIKLYRDDSTVRVISGTVFEDERTDIKGKATVGDGIRDNKDNTLINGVTVQLVELMENGTEYVWREFGDNNKEEGQLGGVNTISKGTGSGTVKSETPIINAYNLISNYEFAENEEARRGSYAFKSFMPGKYVVRFIYGDTERTVLTNDNNSIVNETLEKTGLNAKSYNGQDYKSTTYQKGVEQHVIDANGNVTNQNTAYTWKEQSTWVNGIETPGKDLTVISTFKDDASNNETVTLPIRDREGKFETIDVNNQNGYLYDITKSEQYDGRDKDHPLVSDAKDIESIRNTVNQYSTNQVTNHKAEVLASFRELPTNSTQLQNLIEELKANTQMTAETGLMVIEFEYDQTKTDGNKKDNVYKILNLDLGLEERPKAQLMTDKEVTNVKLVLANGSILFDAKDKATNVLWRDHKAYNEGLLEGTLDIYDGNFMKSSKFGSISNIRDLNSSKFGLIQLSMDEELMHGATMEITYKITVTNIGEVDYYNTYKVGDTNVNMCDRKFYYTGNKSDNALIVTTRADKVIDYVANNLQFDVNRNSDYWNVISEDDLLGNDLVNNALKKQVEKYNTIIVTEKLGTELLPLLEDKDKSSISVPLVLTQLITSENDTDDLSYRNIIEIVQTSNKVARRMEYSVVGNQNPSKDPQELDSDIAEVVKILPPFGNAGIYIIITIISLISITIITISIILIKKKVLIK